MPEMYNENEELIISIARDKLYGRRNMSRVSDDENSDTRRKEVRWSMGVTHNLSFDESPENFKEQCSELERDLLNENARLQKLMKTRYMKKVIRTNYFETLD